MSHSYGMGISRSRSSAPRIVSTGKNDPLNCHGSCFVHDLPPAEEAALRTIVNRTLAADPSKSVLLYYHSYISTETNASAKYADSIVTNSSGQQVVYERCDPRSDYPLFYGTGGNAYGRELEAYFLKALSLGFTGIYHDEFCASNTGYTFSEWDGRSAALDPATGAIARKLGHLCLLTQAHEMKLANIIRDAGGQMTFNGQPSTRTWRNFAQRGGAAGASGGALLHEVEDSEESRTMFTHLHTPIALLRYGGATKDLNPKYNSTCGPAVVGPRKNMTACVGRNTAAHLDYGVAPYLYDGLWPKGSDNIMQHYFPLEAPLRVGAGTLAAANRVVTKRAGTYVFPGAGSLEVALFDGDGVLLSTRTVDGDAAAVDVGTGGEAAMCVISVQS